MASSRSYVNYVLKDDDHFNTITTNIINNEIIYSRPVTPKLLDYMDDGHDDLSPMVLVGFHGSQPVFRVTTTLANEREGNRADDFIVHWPALFPNIIIPICGPLQLDITFRLTDSNEPIPTVEGPDSDEDNDDDDENEGGDEGDDEYDEGFEDDDDPDDQYDGFGPDDDEYRLVHEFLDATWA